MTTVAALDRLLDPLTALFSADVAQQFVQFRVDDMTQARLDDLAQRSNSGELSADEQTEYASLVSAIDLVSVLQAKARRVLKSSAAN